VGSEGFCMRAPVERRKSRMGEDEKVQVRKPLEIF
jgi:hypothetical protein